MTVVLTVAQRDILIEHMDGTPVTLIRPQNEGDEPGSRIKSRRMSIQALVRRGCLQHLRVSRFRIETTITERGREVLAKTLADWADALARAGWNRSGLNLLPNVPAEIAEPEKLDEAFEL